MLAPARRREHQQADLEQLQRVQHHRDGDGQGEVHPTSEQRRGHGAFEDAKSPVRACDRPARVRRSAVRDSTRRSTPAGQNADRAMLASPLRTQATVNSRDYLRRARAYASSCGPMATNTTLSPWTV